MKDTKENWIESDVDEAVSIFGLGGIVKCVVPKEYCDEAFEICDEGDAEYIFDHNNYEDTMPLTERMILHGNWYSFA